MAILCASYAFQYATLCWVALVFGVLTFVWHCAIVGSNPNSDMARNRTAAQNAIANGSVQLVQQGTGPVLTTVPLSTAGLRLALLLIGALCLFPLAEIQRHRRLELQRELLSAGRRPGDTSRFT